MPLPAHPLRAIVFDYGNTLIPFGRPQLTAMDTMVARALETCVGPIDRERFFELRARDRVAPYGDTSDAAAAFREIPIRDVCCNWLAHLFDAMPHDAVVDELLRAKTDAFVQVAEVPDYVGPLLARLGQRYQLALLSNYPDARAIRATLDRLGLREHFSCVVVSEEVGYVKPHPRPFEAVLQALAVPAEQVMFVGDNWLGDVQGAKRAGMWAAYLQQFEASEPFEPQEGDYPADVVLGHLLELEDHV